MKWNSGVFRQVVLCVICFGLGLTLGNIAYIRSILSSNNPQSTYTVGNPTPQPGQFGNSDVHHTISDQAEENPGIQPSGKSFDALQIEIQRLLRESQSLHNDRLLVNCFEAIGKIDGSRAYALANTLPRRLSSLGRSAALRGWAFSSPDDAWQAMVKEQNESATSGNITSAGQMMALIRDMCENGNESILPGKIAAIEDQKNAQIAASYYTQLLSQYNPEKALNYVNSLSAENRTIAQNALLSDLARDAPEEAASIAMKMPAEYAVGGLRSVVNTWMQQDPTSAIAWVLRQAPSRTLDSTLLAIALHGGPAVDQASMQLSQKFFSPDAAKAAIRKTAPRK